MQFLLEAVFLTSVGGIMGIALGSAIGLVVNFFAGFPVSLPWWSFALGLGFSATNYNTWTVNYTHGSVNMPVEFNIYPASDSPANRAAWEVFGELAGIEVVRT